MRAFQVIESNISMTKEQIEDFERKKEQAAYNTDSVGLGAGICALVSLLPPMLVPLIEMDNDPRSLIICSLSIVSVFAALAYLAQAWGVGITTAGWFMTASGIMGIVWGAERPRLINLYLLYLEEESTEANILFLFVLVPVASMFIGSLVIFIRETIKKNACKCKEMELAEKISTCQSRLSSLNTELAETKVQANMLYSEEAAKEQPSRAQMELLANIGLESAQEWLRKTDYLRGKQIFDEEIKKEQPDMAQIKLAADLGYPQACMYYAEPLLLGYASDPFFDDDGDPTPKTKRRLCYQLQPYFKTAANAKMKNAKFYYLYTTERAGKTGYIDYQYSSDDLDELQDAFKEVIESKSIDSKVRVICEQCKERITKALCQRYVEENNRKSEWAGFFSDLPSYQRMVNSAAGTSTSRVVEETVEYVPVVDVTGM